MLSQADALLLRDLAFAQGFLSAQRPSSATIDAVARSFEAQIRGLLLVPPVSPTECTPRCNEGHSYEPGCALATIDVNDARGEAQRFIATAPPPDGSTYDRTKQ